MEYSKITKPLLVEEIKKRGLRGYSKFNKEQLIDMLETEDLLNTRLVPKKKPSPKKKQSPKKKSSPKKKPSPKKKSSPKKKPSPKKKSYDDQERSVLLTRKEMSPLKHNPLINFNYPF
jgi:outer membrane biosynthesis protein TonB